MTDGFWSGQTVMVTGGSGFLGEHVVASLENRAPDVDVFVPRSDEYDLRERAAIERALEDSNPDIVLHLAATVGGIGAGKAAPAEFFYDNAVMGIELIDAACEFGVDKMTTIGSVCSYPKDIEPPFTEDDLFDGYPEETNAPYGIAKRALLTQSWAYREQHGFDCLYLVPVNLYGPGDDFDPETSHVIPAIIRKCVEAKERGEQEITAWGTGSPTREFLYVEDAACGVVAATERYDEPQPVNLGSGHEISIRNLVELIAELTGFEGTIEWDTSKPDGQPRRRFDSTRASERFGWEASTPFETGLIETIRYYRTHRDEILECPSDRS